MSDIQIIEVSTKAEAEKAIQAGHGIRIIAGTFALSLVNVSVPIIIQGDACPSIVTWGTSAPHIETWGTSAPSIETWGTSAPSIVTRGTSAPSIVTRGASAPHIVTWGTSSPYIETWGTSAPHIVTRGTSAPHIVTRGTSAPSIETWGTSAPSINNSDNPVPLIYLNGFRWRITISAERMAIGCQEHYLDRWWAFSDRQIAAMDSQYALEFWRANKAHLQAICAATGRNAGLDVAAPANA